MRLSRIHAVLGAAFVRTRLATQPRQDSLRSECGVPTAECGVRYRIPHPAFRIGTVSRVLTNTATISKPPLSRLLACVLFLCAPWVGAIAGEQTVVRVGHFPNVTHAQAVIAHGLSRKGTGWFEQRLGADVAIQWFVFNAGPSAMEAIFAKSLDLGYVGPNPAINAHLKARGEEIRIVAGACSGGTALVVQPDGRIKTDADFKGKKVATPQFANTQDVAARSWLRSKGHRVTMTGGDVLVVPTSNPDQLALFQKGDLDAVWTVEPWVTRLTMEAKGKVYLDESQLWPETDGRYVTTQLVSSVRFLKERPALLKKWVAAHVELTNWINENPEEAKRIFNQEIKAETTRALPQAILDGAWKRLELTHDPIRASLLKSAQDAHQIGFLRQKPDLSRIYELGPLNDVLKEMGQKEVLP